MEAGLKGNGSKAEAKLPQAIAQCSHATPLRQPDVKPAKRSFMLQTFIRYARFYRFFGCLYIRNINDKTLKSSKVTWKSIYTLYAVAWLTILGIFEGSSMLRRLGCSVNLTCTFVGSLGVISHFVAAIKVVSNVICLAHGSTRILKFLRDAGEFERCNAFVAPRTSVMVGRSWLKLALRLVLLASLVATLLSIALVHQANFSSVHQHRHPVFKTLVLCSSAGFMIHESTMYMFVTCFCEVLVRYLKAQVAAFDEWRPTSASGIAFQDSACTIEGIRVNICKIRRLKTVVNDVWCPAIVTSSACLVGVLSIALRSFYCMTRGNLHALLGASYAAFSALCFIDMVLVSSDLGSEVYKLKNALKTVSALEATDDYYRQIRYLHDVLEPNDMCLTAGRFFRLDRSLLVTMTGSIITFTVILVQTSDKIKHAMETKE